MTTAKPKIPMNRIDVVSLVIYVVHIILNLYESPFLKHFYVLSIFFFLFCAFRKPWSELLVPTLVFFFIEGQGRVVGEYHAIFRTIFDGYILIMILRHTVKRKSISLPDHLPLFFKLMIIGHFGWYFVQLFNVASVGPLGPIFATKIYIFPIIMFFMFLENPLPKNLAFVAKKSSAVLLILILQLIVVFYQFNMGDSSLLNISPYYSRPMRGDVFAGEFFRPFGTGFVPGAMSIYFAFSIGFFYLKDLGGKFKGLIRILVSVGILAACFIMQVRVGLILSGIIIFLCALIAMNRSRLRLIGFPALIALVLSVPIFVSNLEVVQEWFPEANLTSSVIRIKSITSVEDLTAQRASVTTFVDTLWDRLSKAPLGLGPGRTGAANSSFLDVIVNDPRYDLSFSWTLDNLYISLAIDLGIGMIFYTLLIIGLPLYVLARYLNQLRRGKNHDDSVLIALICVFANLVTSWGAISIPYNPSSFFYWFWLAYAMNHLDAKNSFHSRYI
ncbi:MAG: hypothetical protein CME71_10295 [Halobacteriovorax sp.]|nr:hypothetical protein [Halobacteriovorax sp.]|tara:strand:+ start:670 stop:2169 length:1500 start_codon:yes stop_codon:yes gene_type:complete